jgi:hypothetical protein
MRSSPLMPLQGFFDRPHSQSPHAPNFAELHPVTGIKIVLGTEDAATGASPTDPRAPFPSVHSSAFGARGAT